MRTPIVAGNWKMNGSVASNAALLDTIIAGVDANSAAEVMVCPPFPYLMAAGERIAGTKIALGAQNVASEVNPGAFTGEVAGAMLIDAGCSHAIVGHSERRALYGETDEVVAGKFVAAQTAGLIPVLCVGETIAERERGQTDEVISRQASAVIAAAGPAALAGSVLAYEPVWAIGTGHTATPEQAQSAHAVLRGLVGEHDGEVAQGLRILYGGSVKGANAAELFAMPDIDGGLIGGAALDGEDFLRICAAADGEASC